MNNPLLFAQLTVKELWSDEVEWRLKGGIPGEIGPEFKQYWLFDPFLKCGEFGRSTIIKRSAFESYWFEEEYDVKVGENVWVFETKAEADAFAKTWYEERAKERLGE